MRAPLAESCGLSVASVTQRAPPLAEDARWRRSKVSGREYWFAQPITFTPYAAARVCSARCRFCSENLRLMGRVAASTLRPREDYFDRLAMVLAALRTVPIGYSLSGLETTDDLAWMLRMLDVLQEHATHGGVTSNVLYTNAAGFADPATAGTLVERLSSFALDWLEISRHHYDAEINQSIMRFRDSAIARADDFRRALCDVQRSLPVKLVCIVQRGGVESAQQVANYLQWAEALGVRDVIFREFSQLDAGYTQNATARYLATHRVSMRSLVEQCAQSSFARLRLSGSTDGYYFWNVFGSCGDMRVTFEASDYAVMQAHHAALDDRRVYKLVFHANGNLCAGWQPERDILMAASV